MIAITKDRTNVFFQVTTRRINFIVDNAESSEEGTSELRDQEKDRSWLMSSLHQIYSRRYIHVNFVIVQFVHLLIYMNHCNTICSDMVSASGYFWSDFHLMSD